MIFFIFYLSEVCFSQISCSDRNTRFHAVTAEMLTFILKGQIKVSYSSGESDFILKGYSEMIHFLMIICEEEKEEEEEKRKKEEERLSVGTNL